ncbi:Protein pxr1, partial [Rasamsonia emersonii CBS 393.64]
MGLAEPRKKIKISHDPNNTIWARSTSGFGYKILTSQGWTPGSFLGARNAAHADTFTAASASHIRVTLKDDTLGLGARPRGTADFEPTGLDAFQGLLGRLNGKSDAELEREQRQRDDARLALYAAKKWQAVRFISGGFLVQEKHEPLAAESNAKDARKEPCHEDKTQKLEGDTGMASVNAEPPGSVCQVAAECDGSKQEVVDDVSCTAATKKKKEKSKKRKRISSDSNDKAETRKDRCQSPDRVHSNERAAGSLSQTATKPREQIPMGRHVIRSRHIQQKKRALMDDKSLNEIFM